ncbi:MAG: 50S ribosomal protein L7/L12 [bacterium JZ-2024 1]
MGIQELVEEIEKLKVSELVELVGILKERFGVSAVPVMGAAPAPADTGVKQAEEKTKFTVVLVDGGEQKVQVVKLLKSITGLGLKEAKELVDNVPKPIKENISADEAEELKKKFEELGAKVQIT